MENSSRYSFKNKTPNVSSETNVSLNASCVNINQYIKAMPGVTIFNTGPKQVVLTKKHFDDELKKQEINLPGRSKGKGFEFSQFISVK